MNLLNTNKILCTGLIIFLCQPAVANRSVEYTESINKFDIHISDTLINSRSNISLSYKGDSPIIRSDELLFPSSIIYFSVPYNSSNYEIETTSLQYDTISINNKSLQVYRENNGVFSEELLKFDSLNAKQNFGTNNPFNDITSCWFHGGFNRIVGVKISPFFYNNREHVLYVLKNFSIRLKWDDSSNVDNSSAIIPLINETVDEKILSTKRFVVNPNDVENNAPFRNNSIKKITSNGELFEYLIVTTKNLIPAFRRLESIRRLKGFTTKIVAIEDILADSRFKDGDIISGINDDAGKLRAFLRESYINNGTKYVLLGGKYPNFPVRDGCTDPTSSAFNTDLYFAELNEKWNKHRTEPDIYYPNLSDLDCELSVGRLNCTTSDEVNNYIDKLWIYEFNPGNGHPEYLDNAYVYVYHEMNKSYNDNIRGLYNSCFGRVNEVLHSVDIHTKGSEVIDHLKNHNYGYVDFQSHGNPEGVVVSSSPTYGINALDNETLYHKPEIGNGLDCMNNKYYPSWSHSMSCTLMPFKNVLTKEEAENIT